MPPEAMQHPSRGGSSPCPHTQKSRRGIKFDYPSCPFPQGRERTRERPRWGPGLLSGDSAQKHGTATLLTHTLGSRGNSGHPNPPGGGGKGDNLHGAQFASDGAELLEEKKKKKVGRDRDRGRVSERFKSRPFPALVPRVLREHPRHRPSSSSTRLPPPSLPSWSPPQAPEGHGGYSVPGKLGSSRELR